MPSSLEASLRGLLRDPVGRELLANMDAAALATRLAEGDPYGDGIKLRESAQLAGADVLDWYHHRLWCAQREALGNRAEPLSLTIVGTEYRDETIGWPTMVVAPMTLPVADTLSIIGTLAQGREVIVYGHEVFADDIVDPRIGVADPSSHQTRSQIASVLDNGGVYCTYGDFCYAGSPARSVELFGQPRPMSVGWIRLAARAHTMLLPVLCQRMSGSNVRVELAEPVRIESTTPLPALEDVAALLAELLEDRIRAAPSQWLLLPTLSFESPEMAAM